MASCLCYACSKPISCHDCMQVLEGYIYLGGTARLGEEVMHAYASAVDTAVLKTLRSILLTRPGLEGRAKGAGILQELIKLLPADLFRVCLARVRSCHEHQQACMYDTYPFIVDCLSRIMLKL